MRALADISATAHCPRLPAARVHRVNVPLRRLLQVYSRWGEGTGELVAAMQAAKGERQVSA